jgi:hypothetical protein
MKRVGSFAIEVIDLLGLSIAPGTPIFIGQTNINHMKESHPVDFDKYFSHLEDILENPDWVIPDPEGGGIQFVKQIDARVIVAVRASGGGAFYARTIFSMIRPKIDKYSARGLFIRYRVKK